MISETEKTEIDILRTNLGDKLGQNHQSDWSLVRWLRQYKHDVHETQLRLLAHLCNRRLYGLDRPIEDMQPVEIMARGHPCIWLGSHDKQGCPIAVRQAGKVDVKGMLNSIKTSDYIRHELQASEKTMRRLLPLQDHLDRPVGMCVIMDLEGLSFDPYTLSLLNSYFKALEEFIIDQNYPMIDEKVILINAPRIMASLCAVLKKLWPYINNVHILGQDYKEKLLEFAEASQIPVRYGGTLKDEDIAEKWIEPEKIAQELWASSHSDPDTFKVIIKPKRRVRFVFASVPEGSSLSWFFKGDHDIGFGVYWIKDDNNTDNDNRPVMVVAKHRSKTDCVPESGSYICARSGTYWFDLCNEHSRWMSKTLHTSIHCISPSAKVLPYSQLDSHAKPFQSD